LQYTSECVVGDIELWILDVEGNEEKKSEWGERRLHWLGDKLLRAFMGQTASERLSHSSTTWKEVESGGLNIPTNFFPGG
jgi:hypothetical protein